MFTAVRWSFNLLQGYLLLRNFVHCILFWACFLCASIQYIRLQGYQLLCDAYSISFSRLFTDVQFCIESFCFGIFSADFVMYCCRISCFEDIYCLCDVYSSSSTWNICCWAMCIGYLSVRFIYALQCVTYGPPPLPTVTTI